MKRPTLLSRRDFLRLTGLGAGALTLTPLLEACSQTLTAAPTSRPLAATSTLPVSRDVTIDLTAAPGTANLLPGQATRVWQYHGQVSHGAADSMQAIPASYLGPILRLQRGQNLKLRFSNQVPDPSIVHWQ